MPAKRNTSRRGQKRQVRTSTSQAAERSVYDASDSHATLIIPKGDIDGDPDQTSSVAAVARSARQGAIQSLLRPRVPTRPIASALERIGMGDLEQHQSTLEPPTRPGMFAKLDSLGATACFFSREEDQDDARNEAGDEYEFISDFSLELPTRLKQADSSSARGRASLAVSEWPEASGVGAAHAMGVRGAGVLVGVVDTGIDADHTEFDHQTATYRFVSLFPGSPYWPPRDVRGFDTDGHGTHVSGIIAGRTVGVAPEASLYVASVIESETTRTSLVRVAYGLDWLLRQFSRPDNEHHPAVLNMSLGFPPDVPGMSQAELRARLRVMRALIRNLYRANVLPLVAIGNEGAGRYGYPGGFEDVLAVGAVDFEHEVASFSGSGDPPEARESKPDLMGYGVNVYSSLERDYEGRSIYQRLDGTSMATPYVAGIAALYRCMDPALTTDEVWNRLLDSALPLSGQPAPRVGEGLARFAP